MKNPNFWVLFIFSLSISSCAILGKRNSVYYKEANTFTIITNVEGANIESMHKKHLENFTPTSQKDSSGYFAINTFKNPNLFKTKLIVSKENYDSEVVEIRKSPRAGVLICDICLFTPLSPIVDMWNPNFYKISSKSKKIEVTLKFSQKYIDQEFVKIQKTKTKEPLTTFLNRFPGSNRTEEIKFKIDSLDFQAALLKNTEESIDVYILEHPNTIYTSEALKIQEEYKISRLEYERVIKSEILSDYTDYLSRFPRTFYKSPIINKMVGLAFNDLNESDSLKVLLNFNENFLLKHKEILKIEDFYKMSQQLSKLIDDRIISENNIKGINLLEYYFNVWNQSNVLADKYENLNYALGKVPEKQVSELTKSKKFKEKLDREMPELMLQDISKLDSEKNQKEYFEKYQKLIPDEYKSSNKRVINPLLFNALSKVSSFSGKVKLYGYSYTVDRLSSLGVTDNFKPILTIDSLIGRNERYTLDWRKVNVFVPFKHKGVLIDNTKANKEELTLEHGKIVEIKLFKDNDLLSISKFAKDSIYEISYYTEGKLFLQKFYSNDKDYYNINTRDKLKYLFEFSNGENITLKEFEKKVEDLQAKIIIGQIPEFWFVLPDYPDTLPVVRKYVNVLYKGYCEAHGKNDFSLASKYGRWLDFKYKNLLSSKEKSNFDKLQSIITKSLLEALDARNAELTRKGNLERENNNSNNSYNKTTKSTYKFCFENYKGKFVLTIINYTDESNFATLQQYNNSGNLEKTITGEYSLSVEGVYGAAEFLKFQPTGKNSGLSGSKFMVIRTGYGTIQSLKDSEERIWNICN
jgi:hypothetical protein